MDAFSKVFFDGRAVGFFWGRTDGFVKGCFFKSFDGVFDGRAVGFFLGRTDGFSEGCFFRSIEGFVGPRDGFPKGFGGSLDVSKASSLDQGIFPRASMMDEPAVLNRTKRWFCGWLLRWAHGCYFQGNSDEFDGSSSGEPMFHRGLLFSSSRRLLRSGAK